MDRPLSLELSGSTPIEIYELIIYHMNSASTLKNCSLTCRAWLQASWRNLFFRRRIVVDRTNFEAFLELIELDSRAVTIIRFIRSLHIEQGDSWLLYRSTGPRNPKPFQFDEYLPRLVGLVSVERLKLGWIRCDIGPSTISALRDNFARVSVLELKSTVLSSSEQFLAILSSFPSLSGLVLGGFAIIGLSEMQYTNDREQTLLLRDTSPVPPNLSDLSCNLAREETIFLFSWFTLRGVESIRKLNVTLIHESSNAVVSTYCRQFGSNLEELTISSGAVMLPKAFDLSPCVKLTTLGINVEFRSRSTIFDADVPLLDSFIPLINIFQTITSESLEEVRIWLRANGDMTKENYNQLDWDGLASVIERPQFKNLLRFSLFAFHKHSQTVKAVLKRRIPDSAHLASIIQVRSWGGLKRAHSDNC
ncbi:hypothetical protein J3R30DRAFT_3554884 [Lentinula aciculospora]|uniref:F-box domain-containing protein n=1 Tax=Lentinula aciculospora TaxID=153920 RepID=A0A9W8ZYR4_9AGAR|nr:hypothetical protein J3R30DRAFT_3554884 [Lentinula aciculospora]